MQRKTTDDIAPFSQEKIDVKNTSNFIRYIRFLLTIVRIAVVISLIIVLISLFWGYVNTVGAIFNLLWWLVVTIWMSNILRKEKKKKPREEDRG